MWMALYGAEQAPTLLVGHSMGGAVAVRLAAEPQVPLIPSSMHAQPFHSVSCSWTWSPFS